MVSMRYQCLVYQSLAVFEALSFKKYIQKLVTGCIYWQDTKVMVEDDYVELEMDELNQHECMATMIALLKHMQRAKIIPLVESVSTCMQFKTLWHIL